MSNEIQASTVCWACHHRSVMSWISLLDVTVTRGPKGHWGMIFVWSVCHFFPAIVEGPVNNLGSSLDIE